MFEINDEELRQAQKKELQIHEAKKAVKKLGYNTIQEAVVDLVILGVFDRKTKTWTEIEDIKDISSIHSYLSLAQAKNYGLNIIRLDDKSDVKRDPE